MRKLASLRVLVFNFLFSSNQPECPSPAEVEGHTEFLLRQLTLEEKIDLTGGVDDFYIQAVKHIGLARTQNGGRAVQRALS